MTIEDKGAKEGKRNSQEKVSWRNPLNESHWPEKNFTACYSYKEICGTLLSEGSYGQLYVSLNKDDVEMAITLFVRSNITKEINHHLTVCQPFVFHAIVHRGKSSCFPSNSKE